MSIEVEPQMTQLLKLTDNDFITVVSIFKRFYLLIFREKGKREKDKEKNINWLPLTSPQLGTWPVNKVVGVSPSAERAGFSWE